MILRRVTFLLGIVIAMTAHAQQASPWVTSVILPAAQKLDLTKFTSALLKRIPSDIPVKDPQDKDDIISIDVGSGSALITLLPSPIPAGELQETCKYAWHWKEACEAVRDHKAHFLVVLINGPTNRLDAAVLQTHIVATVIEASNAVAAYWGTNLQSRDSFLKGSFGVSASQIPIMLWVSFRLSRETSGNFSMSTKGLADFGLMELEAKDAPMPGADLFDLVTGVSQYLISRGPVIGDGDTVGQSANQRIKVRHMDSYWNEGQKVYRIDFGG